MDMLLRELSAPPPGGEPDEFVLSDDSVDRMGDVIDAEGLATRSHQDAAAGVVQSQQGRDSRQLGATSARSAINWSAALSGPILRTGRRANIFAIWCAADFCARCRLASGRWRGSR